MKKQLIFVAGFFLLGSGELWTQGANPVPQAIALSPSSVEAGGGGFILTVDGSSFVSGSIVRWNGLDRPTSFVSPMRLTASISAADIASPATISITVFNPPPGGGTSGVKFIKIFPACGQLLHSYKGVSAFSNGIDQGSGKSCGGVNGQFGSQYQCVEYVRRFYSQALGTDTSRWRGNGGTYYNTASTKGLIAVPNGGPARPYPDDILVFSGNNFGHVAVIIDVSANSVDLIEENWSPTGRATVPLTSGGSSYSLASRGSYQVIGWLRRPQAILTIETPTCPKGTSCTGPQGTVFDFEGMGFTPNGSVRRFLEDSTGTLTELAPVLVAQPAGQLSWSFDSCTAASGTFLIVAVDETTGRITNKVSEIITPGSCVPPPPPAPAIAVTPPSFDFGNVNIGSPRQSTFTITNTGTALLTVNSISVSAGDFALDTSSFPNPPFDINAGDGQAFQISFAPTVVGLRQATVTITSNATTSPTAVNVTGTGAVAPSGFVATGNLNIPRAFHTATLLSDGRVLIAGGFTTDNFHPIADAEIYDPANGTFTLTGSLNVARWGHSAVPLDDGRVLIVGGNTACCSPFYVAQTEIYDAATGQFTFGPSLPEGRGGAAASVVPLVKLQDGSVLVIGGFRPDICGIPTETVFRIDAQATSISNLGAPLLIPHGGPTTVATLLKTGEILVTSAKGNCFVADPGPPYSELYDPVGNTSRLTAGDILTQRVAFGAVLLNDGRYVLVGGTNSLGMFLPMEVYNPLAEIFTNTNDMTFLATDVVGVLLPDGRALFTGNTVSPFGALLDPASLSFTEVFPGVPTRRFHTLTRLQDGRVLLAGGEVAGATTTSAELFFP